MSRLCGYCKHRNVTNACCDIGFLQAVDAPCVADAPWSIREGKVLTYSEVHPLKALKCSICESPVMGREWAGTEDGHGICDLCFGEVERDMTSAQVYAAYGLKGINYYAAI